MPYWLYRYIPQEGFDDEKENMIALMFSVACVVQGAVAVDKNTAPVAPITSITTEEVAALATAVQATIQEGKKAGKTNEQIATEITHTVFGGSNLAGEQNKKYTKAAKIICGILGVAVVEEVLLPAAAKTWWKESHWLLQFGYCYRGGTWLWNKMFPSEEAEKDGKDANDQLKKTSAVGAGNGSRDGSEGDEENEEADDDSEEEDDKDPVVDRIRDLKGLLTFVNNNEALSEELIGIQKEDDKKYKALPKGANLQKLNAETMAKLDEFEKKVKKAAQRSDAAAGSSASR